MTLAVRKRFQLLVIGLCVALSCMSVARAESRGGPRETVKVFMEALKKDDFIKAMALLDVKIPTDIEKLLGKANGKMKTYFTWVVEDYKILDVHQDGGLAIVTVREKQFRQLGEKGRENLTRYAPIFLTAIHWGVSDITERFVLIHLDGRWVFDYTHSGVKVATLFKKLVKEADDASGPSSPTKDAFLKDVAAFINRVGFGQLLQSMASMGPLVEMGAYFALIKAKAPPQIPHTPPVPQGAPEESVPPSPIPHAPNVEPSPAPSKSP